MSKYTKGLLRRESFNLQGGGQLGERQIVLRAKWSNQATSTVLLDRKNGTMVKGMNKKISIRK